MYVIRYLIVTDGQTDRQTDGQLTVASPRSALASRGKNALFSRNRHRREKFTDVIKSN